MIQIYKPSNTDYEKNGDQTLLPVSASVHAILNGAWEAEITHPIDADGRWKYITEEAVIEMPSFNGDQLFRVKTAQKQDSGVTATLEPIFYDSMGDCWLSDVRPTGKNGQDALDIMLAPNSKYSGLSNITRAATAYYQNMNFMQALNGDIDQSFINRWGGEILFDNFTVIVNDRVGGDYGIELRYGKNIPQDGMSYEVDTRDVVTRIYPQAYNGYKMTGNGYVDSPLINNYPTVKAVSMTFDNVKMRDDAQEDDEENGIIICDTQEELDAALTQQCEAQYDAGIDKPTVTISADMVLLQNTEQYKDIKTLEAVSLGDTIHCINTHLDITTDARVIEIEFDAVRKKVSSVVIGDFQKQYFDGLTDSAQKIDSVVNPDGSLMAEKVQGILNGIYTQLRLQSTVSKKVDGVAFKVEELDEDTPLYGCMVWGTQGIQISTTRTADGKDWDWTTAITAKGIVANAIITGILSDKTGDNYWNLDTGEFRLTSSAFKLDGENVGDYVYSTLDQQKIFDKLTNNGAAKGLYLTDDNELYVNATYIKTGIIADEADSNYWNLTTGEFRLSPAAKIGDQEIAVKEDTIESVDVQYASGTSNTTAPTSGWSTNSPEWQEGKYIWQRTVTTMQNGEQNISDPTCIQGAAGKNGETGATGIGVSQIVEQYYLSNSSTTQTGGSWSSEQPDWKEGKYIWTRSVVTWTDGNATNTDPVLASAINGANEKAEKANQSVENLDQSLNQQEIFDRLTNNGAAQGIYLTNGQLYISFSYARGGILRLGDQNNGDGEMEVYDSAGNLIGKWDMDGFSTIGDYFSVDENGETFSTRFYCSKLRMAPTIGDTIHVDTIKSTYSTVISVGASAGSTGVTGNSLDIGEGRSGDPENIVSMTLGSEKVVNGFEIVSGRYIDIYGDARFHNDLTVSGEKNRTVNTPNFGDRLLHSYETTSPTFGDVGTAKIDSSGECVIYIDDILYETINTDIEYQVFLQAEGEGGLFVKEKKRTYFTVKGEPGLKFAWEIKAKQRDYEYNRLEMDVKVANVISADHYLPTSIKFEELEDILYEAN